MAFLFLIIYNVSVVKGMANSFEVLMDLPYWGGVLISGLVIIFYVVLGGYMAVVWTSFIQAWVMIVALCSSSCSSTVRRRSAAWAPGWRSSPRSGRST